MRIRLTSTMISIPLCLLLAACGGGANVKLDDVPVSLRVAQGQQMVLKVHATGVQIYVCQPSKDDSTRLEWAFKAPEAALFGRGGRQLGKHYAGPSWESNDGSKVVGSVLAKETLDRQSIPWLLLRAKSNSGKGVFSEVRSIQRLRTVGGIAPPGACSPTQLNQELRTSYSADYVFYK